MSSILKKFCCYCKNYLSKSYFSKHLRTRKHLKNVIKTENKIKENEKIKNKVLTLPKELLDIIINYKEDMEEIQECTDICKSVNSQLEKKYKKKSNRIYSRSIKLNKPIKCSRFEETMIYNIHSRYKLSILYKMQTIREENKNKLVKRITLQYDPLMPYPQDYLYIYLH